MDIGQAKTRLRAVALERRAGAPDPAAAAIEIARLVAGEFDLPAGTTVSGYAPVRGEVDPGPLMAKLAGRGAVTGLPVIQGRGRPLIFRRWRPGETLEPGPFKVPVPPDSAPIMTPDLMLVPLLAFDTSGHRLGYGAGYYDRTIAALREAGRELRAIGLAFAVQQVGQVPHDRFDQPLDWVVSEHGCLRCRRMPATPGS